MTKKQCYLGTYVMSSFLVHLFSIAMPTPPHVNRNSVLFLLVGASCCSSLLVLHHRHPLETGRVTRKPGLSLSDLKQLCSSSSREHLQLSSSVSHVAHIGHDKEIGHSTPRLNRSRKAHRICFHDKQCTPHSLYQQDGMGTFPQ